MKNWYVVQVVPGYEERVKQEIERRIGEKNIFDDFGEVLIPQARPVQLNAPGEKGKEEGNEQLFPGYILVKLVPSVENFRLITTVNRVYRVLGGDEPTPIKESEINLILAQVRGDVLVAKVERSFEVGKEVDIVDGPFAGFSGFISAVDDTRKRMTVLVSIFGRSTPVEISFDQIKG